MAANTATVVTISASEPAAELERALQEGLDRLERDCGIAVRVEVDRAADPAVLRCRFEPASGPGPVNTEDCRRWLAGVLADFVVDRMEPTLLRRRLRQGYRGLREHSDAILTAARRQLAGAAASPVPPPAFRRDYIRRTILRYLAEEGERLHLDGLLTFRMTDYLDELESVLDWAVEDVLIEREDREFVMLLRSFVELQEPRLDLVHVLIGRTGNFAVTDGDGRRVAHEELAAADPGGAAGEGSEVDPGIAAAGWDAGPLNVRHGDVLISALVAIAPRRVLLHDPFARFHGELADILRDMFPQRLHVCTGCRHCEHDIGRRDG